MYVKREVFKLLSLTADMPVNDGARRHKREELPTVLDEVEGALAYAKKVHFPTSMRGIHTQSNEMQNFMIMVQAFLDLAVVSGNLKIIRHLYQQIRESSSCIDSILDKALNTIICK